MEERELTILRGCALFSGCSESEILAVIKRCGAEVNGFPAKKKIPCSEDGQARLGIIISGQVLVLAPGGNETILNRLCAGDVFGVSAFFGSGGAGTEIVTEKESEILLIREDRAEPFWENRMIRKNLIRFLTDRICFLNRKIAAFTEGSAKKTLACYLLQGADEKGVCAISPSYSALAKELSLGRASLYRALDELVKEGLIKKEKKEVFLLDRETLKLYL